MLLSTHPNLIFVNLRPKTQHTLKARMTHPATHKHTCNEQQNQQTKNNTTTPLPFQPLKLPFITFAQIIHQPNNSYTNQQGQAHPKLNSKTRRMNPSRSNPGNSTKH